MGGDLGRELSEAVKKDCGGEIDHGHGTSHNLTPTRARFLGSKLEKV